METVIKKRSTQLNGVRLMARFACAMKQMAYVERSVTSPDDQGEAQIERRK